MAHSDNMSEVDRDLCYTFNQDKITISAVSLGISLTIVVVNLLLRTLVSILGQYIGIQLNEEITMVVMTMIFVGQYINTALSQVIASANFLNTPLRFIPGETSSQTMT